MANKKYEGALQELALAAADGKDERAQRMLRALPGERAAWVAKGGLRMAVMAAPFIRPAEWRELLAEFGLAMAGGPVPELMTEEELTEVAKTPEFQKARQLGQTPVVVASQWEVGDAE